MPRSAHFVPRPLGLTSRPPSPDGLRPMQTQPCTLNTTDAAAPGSANDEDGDLHRVRVALAGAHRDDMVQPPPRLGGGGKPQRAAEVDGVRIHCVTPVQPGDVRRGAVAEGAVVYMNQCPVLRLNNVAGIEFGQFRAVEGLEIRAAGQHRAAEGGPRHQTAGDRYDPAVSGGSRADVNGSFHHDTQLRQELQGRRYTSAHSRPTVRRLGWEEPTWMRWLAVTATPD